MRKVLKNARTFIAGFMALMMIVSLLPMTALAVDPDGEPGNDGQNNEQQGNPGDGQNDPQGNPEGGEGGPRQIRNGNVVFEVISQAEAEVLYKLDDGTWYLVDADKNNEQFANNVNFNEADLNGISKITVRVNLNGQAFDDYNDPDTNIGNNNLRYLYNGNEFPDKSVYHLENTTIATETGFSFDYFPGNENEFMVQIRFAGNNNNGGGDSNDYLVNFGSGTVNGNVVTYRANDTDVTLTVTGKNIDQETNTLYIEESEIPNVTFTYDNAYDKENMCILLFCPDGFSTNIGDKTNVESKDVPNPFIITDYTAEHLPDNNVTLEIRGGDKNNQPTNEKPNIILVSNNGSEDVVLVENGEIKAGMDGITVKMDGNVPEIILNGFEHPEYTLTVVDTANLAMSVQGNNVLFGMEFGRLGVEIRGDDHSALSIGGAGIKGDGDTRIKFCDDLTLTINAGTAFDSFEEVLINNYNFHEREKINTTINADVCGFKNVKLVDVSSAKARIAMNPEDRPMFENDDNSVSDLLVFAEGQVTADGNLGAVSLKSRYYFKYPGDGEGLTHEEVGHDLNVDSCMKTVDIFADDLTDQDKASFTFEGTTLTSLDPILYSVSYQVDPGIENMTDENGELVLSAENADPNAGEIIMNGFKKGYWIKDGTGGRFEAWIAAGENVNVTILPSPGYQYVKRSLNINGMKIDTDAGEGKGTYSFVMGPHAGHICAGFLSTEDVVKISSQTGIKDAGIIDTADGAIEAGNVELEIGSAAPSDADMAKIEAAADYDDAQYINLDLTLSEYVVKNYDPEASEQDAWETPLTDLNGKGVTIGIALPDDVDAEGKEVKVVRLHDDQAEVIDSEIMEIPTDDDETANVVVFETDKFSTYAIAYTSKYVITQGDNQTITMNEGDEYVIFKANGSLSKFVKALMDGKEMPAGSYEVLEGSTILMVKRSYLDTLDKGAHALTFVYVDGEVTAHFTLQKRPSGNDNNNSNSSNDPNTPTLLPVKDSVPKTGERYRMLFVLLFISGAAVLGMGFSIKALRNKE